MARARDGGRPVRDSMHDHSTKRANLDRWPVRIGSSNHALIASIQAGLPRGPL